ncbi:MAG: hypothetical protein P8I29_01780 [Flavobacteriales bacterium]|nr:hypothetical protein [Flavobacteriales bacterium]
MKKNILSYCLVLLSSFTFAQKKVEIDAEASFYYNTQDYFSAVYFYELSLQKDSNSFSDWYPLAESYRQTNQYSKGISAYKSVLTSKKSAAFPNTLLWLGVLHKNKSEYDKASTYLKQFLDESLRPTDYWYRKALMEWKGAQMALSAKKREDVQVELMGEQINSSYSDFAPFPLGDSALYFSSMVADDGLAEELYIGHRSQFMQSQYGGVAELFKVFNDLNYHMANISFSPMGEEAYFSKCKTKNGDLICQIYTSRYRKGLWSVPELMDERFNESFSNNTHPQWGLWKGDEGLFIASDRVGGLGDMDIWFVPMQGSAINLGNGINTSGKEVTPFYHSVEKALYFSSDFHPGFGGFDIFKSLWEENWGLVENVGKPLNSPANDLYYVSPIDSFSIGFFSSNREGSRTITTESCCNDIYRFTKTIECVCVEVDSISAAMRLNLPLSLYFHNDEPNPKTRDSVTSVNYTDAYNSFMTQKDQYIKRFSSVMSGRAKNATERQMHDFFEQTVSGGYQSLLIFAEQLEEVLALEAKVEIKLKGYTSPLTASDYNNLLAKRRISSVENFLKQFNSGVLIPYLQNDQLVLTELPLGETQVSIGVSDNPNDRRNSVYSIKAAQERRIEIVSVLVEFN